MCEIPFPINKLHTTQRGFERIKRNLHLPFQMKDEAILSYCKAMLTNQNCQIQCKGKNLYCQFNSTLWVIHATCYTIITAHLINKKEYAK